MFRIKLDPGHGMGRAHNRGGVCFNEGDNNYAYSLILKEELEKIPGVFVSTTRPSLSSNPSLTSRAASGAGYDLFISIHSNGAISIVRGSEIWDSVEKPNKALAQKLVSIIAEDFNHRNRGSKYKVGQPGFNWYGVLRFNKAKSAMIIEHGFHSNHLDCNHFKSNHRVLAVKTAKAISDHYKLGVPNRGEVSRPTVSKPAAKPVRTANFVVNGNNDLRSVIQLQDDLQSLGFSVGEYGSDGIFGNATKKAVENFQRAHKLKVDGYAGKDTLGKIRSLKANQGIRIAVDGYWGPATTKALQKNLGTIVDGVISGQYNNATTRAISGTVRTGSKTGSNVVKALQKKVKTKADGYIGPNTIKALQKYLGTTIDGHISRPSLMVRELQRRLNKGNL